MHILFPFASVTCVLPDKIITLAHLLYCAVGSPGRYVSILVELTRMEGTRHGGLIAAQMLDVAIRVQAIRHFAVSQMVSLFIYA